MIARETGALGLPFTTGPKRHYDLGRPGPVRGAKAVLVRPVAVALPSDRASVLCRPGALNRQPKARAKVMPWTVALPAERVPWRAA